MKQSMPSFRVVSMQYQVIGTAAFGSTQIKIPKCTASVTMNDGIPLIIDDACDIHICFDRIFDIGTRMIQPSTVRKNLLVKKTGVRHGC